MYQTKSDFLANVQEEIRDQVRDKISQDYSWSFLICQQVRRLQHHASLVLWAGNNENEAALVQNWYGTYADLDKYKADYKKLYVDTIKTIVTSEDSLAFRPFIVTMLPSYMQDDLIGLF